MLASGATVTANSCRHPDLFTALRGGGGGTFGVVVSATIKAYPTRPVLAHTLEVVPVQNNSLASLLDVSAYLVSQYPLLSDRGFAGLAKLVRTTQKAAYQHTFIKLIEGNGNSAAAENATVEDSKRAMTNLTSLAMAHLNTTDLYVKSRFRLFPSFHEYFQDSGSHQAPASSNLVMASRFFDKKAMLDQQPSLSRMLHVLFSTASNSTSTLTPTSSVLELCLVGGGRALHPVPYTAVNPAWRETYMLAEHIDVWSENNDNNNKSRQKYEYEYDTASTKLDAMKVAAPGTGTYLNEADRYDPDWKRDWFGDRYEWLRGVKRVYDPDGVFWCWRCVGSEGWHEVEGKGASYGPLCSL